MWFLKRSFISTLWDALYIVSHKVEISERSKNAENVQLSINVLILNVNVFSKVRIHQFFILFYSLSHKVEIIERSKTSIGY